VRSPFQAILDYELSHDIPDGWINYSISRTAPNGFWHRLELGAIPLDDAFYTGFGRDLCDAARWRAFWRDRQGVSAKGRRRGDDGPRRERVRGHGCSGNEVFQGEKGVGDDGRGEDALGESGRGKEAVGVKGRGEQAFGDDGRGEQAVGVDGRGEKALGQEAHTENALGPNGRDRDVVVHQGDRGEGDHDGGRPGDVLDDMPALPAIDAKELFNSMMTAAAQPDPWMLPALIRLKSSHRFILAALSNTVIFPSGHLLHKADFVRDDPVRRLFDVVVSSAHEGVRKPDPRAYRLALDRVNGWARVHAGVDDRVRRLVGLDANTAGIAPGDVLFLDDIGENLREARRFGFATLKVPLGRAYETVEELERVTGLCLEGSHPKVPVGHGPESKARM
jgi:FMN phosphatase YigB (HAD superfamily)